MHINIMYGMLPVITQSIITSLIPKNDHVASFTFLNIIKDPKNVKKYYKIKFLYLMYAF